MRFVSLLFFVPTDLLFLLFAFLGFSSYSDSESSAFAFDNFGVFFPFLFFSFNLWFSFLLFGKKSQLDTRRLRLNSKMREIILGNKDILLKLEQMERKTNKHDADLDLIFSALKKLLNPPNPPRRKFGFIPED